MKARRLALSEEERMRCSMQCVTRIRELMDDLNMEKGTIAVYIPTGNEVDVTELIGMLGQAGWIVAAPRVAGRTMHFYEIHSMEDCEKGHYGILEPRMGCRIIDGDRINCMIIPGLAFDLEGNRLGYGGGYYDRYLAGHPGIVRIAVAYDFQLVDELPSEQHDCRMNYLVTDRRRQFV